MPTDDLGQMMRLVEALRPWLGETVIVGGWAHRLYRLHPSAGSPAYQPVRTRDADVAFAPTARLAGNMATALKKAADSELGLALMRHILRLKLDGQERVLRNFTAGQLAIPYMEVGRRALDAATDYPSLRFAEGRAAAAYWGAWAAVKADFKVTTRKSVPDHWLRFGQRSSALSGSPRLAVNPLNAMLNYVYAILETEARLALLAVGCDPGLGLMHVDANLGTRWPVTSWKQSGQRWINSFWTTRRTALYGLMTLSSFGMDSVASCPPWPESSLRFRHYARIALHRSLNRLRKLFILTPFLLPPEHRSASAFLRL